MPRTSFRRLVLSSIVMLAFESGASNLSGSNIPNLLQSSNSETASAQMLSEACAGCHGIDGVSGGPATPTIAGLSIAYFIEVMQGYRNNKIPSTIMGRIARGYNDEELEKMAGYFSALTYSMAEQTFDAELAKKGEDLHDRYCENCHQDAGKDPEDESGYLGGQWKPFIRWTLEDYISGDRKMTRRMEKKVKRLLKKHDKQGINALIEFYANPDY